MKGHLMTQSEKEIFLSKWAFSSVYIEGSLRAFYKKEIGKWRFSPSFNPSKYLFLTETLIQKVIRYYNRNLDSKKQVLPIIVLVQKYHDVELAREKNEQISLESSYISLKHKIRNKLIEYLYDFDVNTPTKPIKEEKSNINERRKKKWRQ